MKEKEIYRVPTLPIPSRGVKKVSQFYFDSDLNSLRFVDRFYMTILNLESKKFTSYSLEGKMPSTLCPLRFVPQNLADLAFRSDKDKDKPKETKERKDYTILFQTPESSTLKMCRTEDGVGEEGKEHERIFRLKSLVDIRKILSNESCSSCGFYDEFIFLIMKNKFSSGKPMFLFFRFRDLLTHNPCL